MNTNAQAQVDTASVGPSFTAALCGFLGSTLATTMVMFLLSSV
ncbi:hypothetical protein [Methylobacterium organophilum]|uniref:Uncharacterized protein n=1 Tax=Methylobacterium organophilum TaxID=410 RepID=A0ABQ4TFK3_METOR|nr:hypothetical protein [Methylobacterium organophilum]GJE28822.1 hypothetical protein LKMONMHP_3696 [Methylobacterium organophilum]